MSEPAKESLSNTAMMTAPTNHGTTICLIRSDYRISFCATGNLARLELNRSSRASSTAASVRSSDILILTEIYEIDFIKMKR